MDVGLLILRAAVGALFVGHGAQKLFGSFCGYGIAETGGFMSSLGYRNGRAMATLAGVAEFGCGALLVLGFLTPFAAAGIIGVMLSAIIAVHAPKGMWNTGGGMEYPIVLSTVAATLAFAGPGAYSMDAAFELDLAGNAWGLSAILLGVITGSIVAMSRKPAPAQAQAEPGATRDRRAA
ncbi:MAG: DoxX family protein [Actinomycetota bacterium]